jgi:hypothetical protein
MNSQSSTFETGNYLLGHAWEDARVQALVEGSEQWEWMDDEDLKKARVDLRGRSRRRWMPMMATEPAAPAAKPA